jgi:hypothetical protein
VETIKPETLPTPVHGITKTPKHVKVVVPVTILGSGKSWMMERLACLYRDQGWVTFLASSDELSAFVIERMRFKANDWRESSDFFDASRKEYRDRWTRSVDHIFERPLGIDADKFVILVDKNHHPFHFRKILTEYQEKLTKLGYTCDFVHVFIDCPTPMAWTGVDGNPITHPLNPKLFYDSLVRINGRSDNALMQNTAPASNLKILSEFFSFFIDYKPYPSKKDSVVFFKCYNDRDEAFAAKVDAALGPQLRAFVEAKKAKAKNTEALLADYLQIFNKFYAENEILTRQNLFPPTDDFEKCIKDNWNAFFGCHLKTGSPDLADIEGITYGGYFFEPEAFEDAYRTAFARINDLLKDQSDVDSEAAQFIKASAAKGIDQKQWSLVENPHMTSVFLGGHSPTKQDLEIWERCHQVKSTHLDLMGLVVVAARLAFFIVKPSAARFTKNKVPHVSLMRAGPYTFYDSNRIGEQLIDSGADFYSHSPPPAATHLIDDLYETGAKVKASVFRFPAIPILGSLRKMYG